jgi:hypothetical protein
MFFVIYNVEFGYFHMYTLYKKSCFNLKEIHFKILNIYLSILEYRQANKVLKEEKQQ